MSEGSTDGLDPGGYLVHNPGYEDIFETWLGCGFVFLFMVVVLCG